MTSKLLIDNNDPSIGDLYSDDDLQHFKTRTAPNLKIYEMAEGIFVCRNYQPICFKNRIFFAHKKISSVCSF